MKEQSTRWIKISVALALAISIWVAIPADNKSKELRAERRTSTPFVVRKSGVGRMPLCVLRIPTTAEKAENPQGPKVERKPWCFGNRMDIKIQLEEYKRQYGFYPSEANWNTFLDDPRFWPPDTPAPKYCPKGNYPYEYKSNSLPDSVLVINEHGTGYSKYRIRCPNGCPYKE